MKETEFRKFLGKLKGCAGELNVYYDTRSSIDLGIVRDIARDIVTITKEDIINDKREYSDKIKNIIRLCHVVDFAYGLTFHKDEFHELLVIVRRIMGLIEDYRFWTTEEK